MRYHHQALGRKIQKTKYLAILTIKSHYVFAADNALTKDFQPANALSNKDFKAFYKQALTLNKLNLRKT